MPVRITPMSETLGARVEGVDLSRPLDDETAARIEDAFNSYHLLSIPGQKLTPQQVVDFSARFGPLEPHVLNQFHHPETPLIVVLSNRVEPDGRPLGLADAGTYWHSDVSYKKRPARATLLYAVEVPKQGGDTLFANMIAAYDALPEDMKARLGRLRAEHNYAYRSNALADALHKRQHLTEAQLAKTPSVLHPVVRTHPVTGRKALYVNPGFTVRFEGLSEEESEPLKQRIFEHCLQDRFRFRYKWQKGDVLIWDNAAVMHSATTRDLDPTLYRTLWRTIIVGDEPR